MLFYSTTTNNNNTEWSGEMPNSALLWSFEERNAMNQDLWRYFSSTIEHSLKEKWELDRPIKHENSITQIKGDRVG